MRYIFKNLIALFGVIFLGVGVVNAATSIDCGDDDAEPITVHSAAKAINKKAKFL